MKHFVVLKTVECAHLSLFSNLFCLIKTNVFENISGLSVFFSAYAIVLNT